MEIVLDSASLFETGNSTYVAVAALDATHFVIAFRDGADNKGKVIVGSVDGVTITITADTAVIFENGVVYDISCAALDSTHFVIAFRDGGDGNKGKVIVGSVDGVTITITADTAVIFENGITMVTATAALDSSHFVIAFMDNADNKGKVIVGSVDGVTITITADTASIFESGYTTEISIAALDSSHFVVAFRDGGDANKGKVIAGSVAGVAITITEDTGSIFENGSTQVISIAALDSSYFVISFRDYSDSGDAKVIAGSVSGVAITITADTASLFESAIDYGIPTSIAALDSSRFVIAFKDGADNKGKVIAGSVDGVAITITADTATEFESGTIEFPSCDALDATHFVIAFQDFTDSEKGRVIVGTEELPPVPYGYGLPSGAVAKVMGVL